MSQRRLIACVLLPFAAGYYLSYLFRTINALIAGDLAADLDLSAMELGLLTSVYFLALAAVQLPLGSLLDRYGPKTIQSLLLLLASAGALVFALAEHFAALLVGRALIGLGVAMALMAGFKALVLWFPREHLALANGWLVMLGALGAITATGPAELIVQYIGWRGLFAVLGGLSALAALLVLFAVPKYGCEGSGKASSQGASLWAIYRDGRFWRIAPLSATGIGTSWSLQGLWAAPWLRDVDGLDRASVVQHLSAMAIVVCASALLLGMLADRLRRVGFKAESLLATTLVASMIAQFALVGQWPLPSFVAWVVIAAAGAATVLSFAILGEYYPKEISGRANAALNLLHVGGAFVLQSAAGFVIALWPQAQGTYPAEAHQAAMGIMLLSQLAAFGWFASSRRTAAPLTVRSARGHMRASLEWMRPPTAYPTVGYRRTQHVHLLRKQCANWRLAAAASMGLCVGLIAVLSVAMSRPAVAIRVVEVDRFVPNVAATTSGTIEADRLVDSRHAHAAYIMPPTLIWPDPLTVFLRAITVGLSR
ncbi:MAG: MFS transporter [Hyphomicrobiaceae bacterium]